jgi:RNA polymerase sigma-70 factor (ECF subfamily)
MPKPGVDSAESDESLVERVRRGDVARFSVLVQRYNRSLYRVARSIVRDDHEAEDIVQHTHVSAFTHLHQFEGRAKFSTWLARIAAHEAMTRLRSRRRVSALISEDVFGIAAMTPLDTPEEVFSRSELARATESAIDQLPLPYRTAFVLRHVEGLDTRETADWIGVSETNLRVMLHRARGLLRDGILEQLQTGADEVFSFGGHRCARVTRYVVRAVSSRLALESTAAK